MRGAAQPWNVGFRQGEIEGLFGGTSLGLRKEVEACIPSYCSSLGHCWLGRAYRQRCKHFVCTQR